MNVSEFAGLCGFRIVAGTAAAGKEISGYYVTDMLSEALGHARSGQVLVTIQTHANVLAVAVQKRLSCVLFTGDVLPQAELCALADREGIPLLVSCMPTFETVRQICMVSQKNGSL